MGSFGHLLPAKRALAALAFLAAPLAAAEVPSGQKIQLHEVLVDAQGATTYLRFRFLAPQIATGATQVSFDLAGQDMAHLCVSMALPYIAQHGLQGDKIVISFMDRITEFGQADPDAVQYFEQFRPENGDCMWDDY
ncbi:MAG: DUF6497 family protein [Sulfitobacter sp.]